MYGAAACAGGVHRRTVLHSDVAVLKWMVVDILTHSELQRVPRSGHSVWNLSGTTIQADAPRQRFSNRYSKKLEIALTHRKERATRFPNRDKLSICIYALGIKKPGRDSRAASQE